MTTICIPVHEASAIDEMTESAVDKVKAEDEIQDTLALSADALLELWQFSEQEQLQQNAFRTPLVVLDRALSEEPRASIQVFKEKWDMSQFWFTDDTARFLARALLAHSGSGSSIAILSAPSVFIQLKNILAKTADEKLPPRVTLLEYDHRFAVHDEFVKFDYNEPASSQLAADMQNAYDVILADPPYHSSDCIAKYAKIISWLSKSNPTSVETNSCLTIFCTGENMEATIDETFGGDLSVMDFTPEHASGLEKPYAAYANFEL